MPNKNQLKTAFSLFTDTQVLFFPEYATIYLKQRENERAEQLIYRMDINDNLYDVFFSFANGYKNALKETEIAQIIENAIDRLEPVFLIEKIMPKPRELTKAEGRGLMAEVASPQPPVRSSTSLIN